MRLCVAQIRPLKGAISENIEKHKQFVERAVSQGADLIVFPELSITGYEPTLARELAATPDDERFAGFQRLSDAENIIIGVGVPTPSDAGVCITMVLFHPNQPRQTYSKQYLHADEEPIFVSGSNASGLIRNHPSIALAICYELSVPAHSENAFQSGAKIYLVSVAKTASGMEKAAQTVSEIARNYAMTVLLANSVGPSDDFVSAGKSGIWNTDGLLIGQLNDSEEGILLLDTETREVLTTPF